MRKRVVKKYGNTWVIKLETSDVKDFGLVEGEKVDIDDLYFSKEENHTHWCGCITRKEDGVISFDKVCKLHKKNKKGVYIALQHKDLDKGSRNK